MIVIYAPTKASAHALLDKLGGLFEDMPIGDVPAGIDDVHWIAVGTDSATDWLPRRQRPVARPPRARGTRRR